MKFPITIDLYEMNSVVLGSSKIESVWMLSIKGKDTSIHKQFASKACALKHIGMIFDAEGQ